MKPLAAFLFMAIATQAHDATAQAGGRLAAGPTPRVLPVAADVIDTPVLTKLSAWKFGPPPAVLTACLFAACTST